MVYSRFAQSLSPVTDNEYYKEVDKGTVKQLIQSVLPPRESKNLLLSLADVYGSKGMAKVAAITSAKQIVFHAVGDSRPNQRTRPR